MKHSLVESKRLCTQSSAEMLREHEREAAISPITNVKGVFSMVVSVNT